MSRITRSGGEAVGRDVVGAEQPGAGHARARQRHRGRAERAFGDEPPHQPLGAAATGAVVDLVGMERHAIAVGLVRTKHEPSPVHSTADNPATSRSEEHTSELQSLMRISYA